MDGKVCGQVQENLSSSGKRRGIGSRNETVSRNDLKNGALCRSKIKEIGFGKVGSHDRKWTPHGGRIGGKSSLAIRGRQCHHLHVSMDHAFQSHTHLANSLTFHLLMSIKFYYYSGFNHLKGKQGINIKRKN